MEWLGLDWDEGPMKGGDCGPYFQSQRNDIYDAYFKKLQDAGRVYEDDGAWRFRFDRSKPVTFHDMICGDITIDYRDASNTPGHGHPPRGRLLHLPLRQRWWTTLK